MVNEGAKLIIYFEYLQKIIFLTGKPRTDGSNLRKLISNVLLTVGLSPEAEVGNFEIIPPKKKGVPKLIREMVDTYIVTTGNSYKL